MVIALAQAAATESPYIVFVQYGALGLILLAFLWAFKRLVNHILDSQNDMKPFMRESTEAMIEVKNGIHELVKEVQELRRDLTPTRPGIPMPHGRMR